MEDYVEDRLDLILKDIFGEESKPVSREKGIKGEGKFDYKRLMNENDFDDLVN
jgi:hypothetical protein